MRTAAREVLVMENKMTGCLFRCENLSAYNSDGYNLENINFNLMPGEVHALVGERGAGKKTFVDVIAGFVKNIKGEIFYQGRNITAQLCAKGIEDVKVLLQKSCLIDNLSIAENLFLKNYPKKIIGLPSIDWQRIYLITSQLLKGLNIELDYSKKISELTKEEKKLVEIVKIYLHDPDIIVLHEPTENLGVKSIEKLYKIIEILRDKGRGIIYVTNQWEEALKISDRISILHKGQLVGTLSTAEAKKNPSKLLHKIYGWTNFRDKEKNIGDEDAEVVEAVFKAAEFLSSDYELKDVLSMLARYATKVMNADGCVIDLIDEGTWAVIDTVTFKTNENFDAVLKKESIITILRKGELFYATENDKNFASLFERQKGVKTIICSPILIRTQITGIIQVFYQDLYAYSDKEAAYFLTLAKQVGIAIEDTRLLGRSALLQESHHRIKNNLQSIISLISLQKDFIQKDPSKSVEVIMNEIISYIKSIAAVHDLLSKDKLGRSIINIKEIISSIKDLYSINRNITINLEIDDIFISYNKATVVALITNELLNNCMKHAFGQNERGIVNITCKKEPKRILLIVEDNGRGLPEDFDLENLRTLGLSIVYATIRNEFKGQIKSERNGTGGTRFIILLPGENLLFS